MYSVYQFINRTNDKTMFVATKNVNNLLQNCNNTDLIEILKLPYIYHLVFADVEKHRVDELINSVKHNKIKLTRTIIDTKNKQEYLQRKQIGDNNEKLLKPIIEDVFNLQLTKTINPYSHFDFYSTNVVVELKSLKKINANVFLGTNKIACKNILFIFKCNTTNELYYLKYNKELFNILPIIETEMKMKTTLSKSFCIPVNYLTRFFSTDKIELIYEFDETDVINDLLY